MKKLAVVFGGASNENEISIITGTMTVNVLKGGKFDPLPVYIAQDGKLYVGDELANIERFKSGGYKKCPRALFGDGGIYILDGRGRTKKFIELVGILNCCHGGAGEGGALSGLGEICSLAVAGAGIFESAAFLDKYLTKIVLAGLGVKTAEYALRRGEEMIGQIPPYPVIVKPLTLGSSIGIEKAKNDEELKDAFKCASIFDGGAIVERYIENRREINCAAYFSGGKAHVSECEEAIGGADILSFEDKYAGGGKRVFPAEISTEVAEKIKETTRYVFEKLDMRGIVRFDYILDSDTVYLSEVNTVPGSLSHYLISKDFKGFKAVLEDIIGDAIEEFKSKRSKKLVWTGILETAISGGKIK